jgi:hypothetical protein
LAFFYQFDKFELTIKTLKNLNITLLGFLFIFAFKGYISIESSDHHYKIESKSRLQQLNLKKI